jgi:ribosomal protein S4
MDYRNVYKYNLIVRQNFRKFYGCVPGRSMKRMLKVFYMDMLSQQHLKREDLILGNFERSLSNITRRFYFTQTAIEMRQFVKNGYLKVNGVVCRRPYSVRKRGDLIEYDINRFRKFKRAFPYLKGYFPLWKRGRRRPLLAFKRRRKPWLNYVKYSAARPIGLLYNYPRRKSLRISVLHNKFVRLTMSHQFR